MKGIHLCQSKPEYSMGNSLTYIILSLKADSKTVKLSVWQSSSMNFGKALERTAGLFKKIIGFSYAN